MASAEQSHFDYSGFLKSHGAELLNDWHLPRGDDLSYWGTDRNTLPYLTTDDEGKTKDPWCTKGDFNTDGIADVAYMLFENTGKSGNLFVFISKGKETYEIHKVTHASKYEGVRTLKARKQNLTIPALKLFEFEGHAITYIWSEASKEFIELPEGYTLEVYK